jgi:hypothetical protein
MDNNDPKYLDVYEYLNSDHLCKGTNHLMIHVHPSGELIDVVPLSRLFDKGIRSFLRVDIILDFPIKYVQESRGHSNWVLTFVSAMRVLGRRCAWAEVWERGGMTCRSHGRADGGGQYIR